MNQSRIDSVMESVVNIAIGLVISTIANFLLLHLFLGYPMHLGENVLISVVFTVISFVRSYSLRRAFNGRSVWTAIKEKYHGHNSRLLQSQVAPVPAGSSGRSADIRLGSDVPAGKRKRSYHFWGIRK